jgi:tRNA (cytidine32/uridine32-2'-O)-methyltransferase
MFSNVHIVLVNTSHPGNIGSTARAMKTMGFKNLSLVNPKEFPSIKANELAVGCTDILKRANLFPDLASALEKSNTNIAFSARSRRASIPIFSVDESITHVMNNPNTTINLIFGNESSGLSNNDLLLCDYIVSLPTHNDYTSLNLSAAVQIITYELHKKSFINPSNIQSQKELATSKEKNFFIDSLISLLENTHFITSKNHLSLKKKIHILFNRSNLEKEEVNMLMGMISSITKKFNK